MSSSDRRARHRAGRRRLAVGAALTMVVVAGCTKTPTPGATPTTAARTTGTLGFTAPTKDELAQSAGFVFPPSTTTFRTVSISSFELDLILTIDRSDLAAFDSGSSLHLVRKKRVITHPSPLWELNPKGTISGSSTRHGSILRNVEVVDGDTSSPTLQVRAQVEAA